MKRKIAWLLVLVLVWGAALPVCAQEVQEKLTKTDRRINFYLAYLQELKDEGATITYVGLLDINKDKLPELFYISPEDGEALFHFCGFDLDSVSVFEYDLDENSLGKAPRNLSLKRYTEVKGSGICWFLRANTGKKNDEDRFEYMAYMIKVADATTLEDHVRFRKTWRNGKTKYRFFINDVETVKSIYQAEVDTFFGGVWERAEPTTYKNAGAIRKVASQKWADIKKAVNRVANAWKDLTPMSE